MSFLSILVGSIFHRSFYVFYFVLVALPSGIRPDLTPEDGEVKRQLGKCRPQAYSDLIKSDIPVSSGVSPSCSPHSRSPPLPAMETTPRGPLAVKPTWGELQACVELLAKKRRSVKRKAQDPLESSLLAQGKVPKLGMSFPRLPVKERGSHAQVWVRGQASLFGRGVQGGRCVESLILYCRS